MTLIEKIVYGSAGSLVLLLFLAAPLRAHLTEETVMCQVKNKERIQDGTKSKYLIFCDGEVLENSDSVWRWKFNSSDVYNNIEVGQMHRFQVYGWRVSFLSMYRNIIQ